MSMPSCWRRRTGGAPLVNEGDGMYEALMIANGLEVVEVWRPTGNMKHTTRPRRLILEI